MYKAPLLGFIGALGVFCLDLWMLGILERSVLLSSGILSSFCQGFIGVSRLDMAFQEGPNQDAGALGGLIFREV